MTVNMPLLNSVTSLSLLTITSITALAASRNDHLDPSVRSQLQATMSSENVNKYVANSPAGHQRKPKNLTDEEREEREAAKATKKAERDRIREEKKAAREAAKAAKRAAAGPGFYAGDD